MGFVWKLFHALFAFLFLVQTSFSLAEGAKCIENERKALLLFKQGIWQDAYGMLSTWRDGDHEDCCNWKGVHCSNETGHIQFLNLRNLFPDYHLGGKINITSLSELHDMEYLDLSGNNFYSSEIPESIVSFAKLRHLNLSFSNFIGTIPYQLGKLSKLQHLSLNGNHLDGVIPFQLGNLSMLQTLELGENYDLTLYDQNTHDAKWLSRLSSLSSLDLSFVRDVGYSHLWLQMIGKLSKLRVLRLSNCGISYTHNPSLTANPSNYSSSLVILDLSQNNLSSTSFQWPFNLSSNLQELYLSGCQLSTTDLHSLFSPFQLSSLIILDLSSNNLNSTSFQWPFNLSSNLQELQLSDCLLSTTDLHSLFSHFQLSSLVILDLSSNNLNSTSFQGPFNLSSNLQELYLSDCQLSTTDLHSLFSHFQLSSLIILDLAYNNLMSLRALNFTPNLQVLQLQNCSLLSDNLIFTSFNPNLTSLVHLDLSDNFLTSISIFHRISNFTFNLREIQISHNLLEGPVPEGFGNLLNSLEVLDLSRNKLQGEIPASLGNICTLKTLNLSYNKFSGELSSFIQNTSRCDSHQLQLLDLSYNQIKGMSSNLSIFSSLEQLDLSNNQLKGEIPESIGLLSKMNYLSMHGNKFGGVITESHFKKLSNLKSLSLGGNSLALKISTGWIAPFQLWDLEMSSCMVGPYFPNWLRNQLQLDNLDISNCGLSDFVPEWFWPLVKDVAFLNISYNNFVGEIPNLSLKISTYRIILTSNSFKGAIPSFFSHVPVLHLSNNKFSNLVPFLCGQIEDKKDTGILDISSNRLEGHLPDCWSHLNSLTFVDLSNNNLSGVIPTSIGQLVNLEFLVLRNNSLNGELPSSLVNCSQLLLLDVSENKLLGSIPPWIGENLRDLQILSLRRNKLYGRIPLHLCHLALIQLLDLSHNNLSNEIPSCFQNFTVLAHDDHINLTHASGHSYESHSIGGVVYGFSFEFYVTLMWKGKDDLFKRPEQLLKSIDLSSNALVGEIPKEVVSLLGLVSLNLSRNKLNGKIPTEIGNLESLEFLDLSRNKLSGPIPQSLAHIDRLTMLDLSNNRLSGKIPKGTQLQSFNATSYEQNLDLCGAPLDKKCLDDAMATPQVYENDNDDSHFTQEFYLGLGLGFAFGFWAFLGPLLFNRTWRQTYYTFIRRVTDRVYILVAIYVDLQLLWLGVCRIIPDS